MTIIAAVTAGNYTHYLDVTLLSQNIAGNYSTISYNYFIHRNSVASYGAYNGVANRSFNTAVDGVGGGGPRTFDFRVTADISMASGTINVAHDAAGNKTVVGAFDGPVPTFTTGFPRASGSGAIVLPQIPRNRAIVGYSGAWHTCEVYYGENGVWKMAMMYVGVGGVWRMAQQLP